MKSFCKTSNLANAGAIEINKRKFRDYRRYEMLEVHMCRNEHASGLAFGKLEDCKHCEKDREYRKITDPNTQPNGDQNAEQD